MKKLINDPRHVVREMLEGAVALAPGQALLDNATVVVRLPLPCDGAGQDGAPWPVAVLSGGGSGHEPAHAGFVGTGMLAAAIAGNVFTSPSVDDVLAGLRAVATPAGALLIVKNYTGDRLNFGLAAEIARAEGIPVEMVVVADDVALRGTVEKTRRRGIAGTVLVHKVAGAAAAAGLPLPEVAAVARRAAEAVGSMGVALGGCTLPAAAGTGFSLGPDEIELGLGIHGEPGVSRTHMRPADELTELMVAAVCDDAGLAAGDQVALLVNGLGATPAMELDIVLRAALAQLRARGIEAARAWRGTLLSALDMPGCSVSVMRLDGELTRLLDAPTDAPAWPGPGKVNPHPALPTLTPPGPATAPSGPAAAPSGNPAPGSQALRAAAAAAAHALLHQEAALTELDGQDRRRRSGRQHGAGRACHPGSAACGLGVARVGAGRDGRRAAPGRWRQLRPVLRHGAPARLPPPRRRHAAGRGGVGRRVQPGGGRRVRPGGRRPRRPHHGGRAAARGGRPVRRAGRGIGRARRAARLRRRGRAGRRGNSGHAAPAWAQQLHRPPRAGHPRWRGRRSGGLDQRDQRHLDQCQRGVRDIVPATARVGAAASVPAPCGTSSNGVPACSCDTNGLML